MRHEGEKQHYFVLLYGAYVFAANWTVHVAYKKYYAEKLIYYLSVCMRVVCAGANVSDNRCVSMSKFMLWIKLICFFLLFSLQVNIIYATETFAFIEGMRWFISHLSVYEYISGKTFAYTCSTWTQVFCHNKLCVSIFTWNLCEQKTRNRLGQKAASINLRNNIRYKNFSDAASQNEHRIYRGKRTLAQRILKDKR